MEDKSTQADILFDIQIHQMKIEAELSDLLETFSKNFNWTDFTYDYYDYSLEIYGVPDHYKLSGDDLIKLMKFGFDIVWTHNVKNKKEYSGHMPAVREKEGERFYKLR